MNDHDSKQLRLGAAPTDLTLFLVTVSLVTVATAQTPKRPAAEAAFQQRNWAAAASGYRQITSTHPDNGLAWYRLGYALHAQGKHTAAIAAHKRAAAFPQVAANAAYNAACAYAMIGKQESAWRWLDKALVAGFASAKTMRNDPDLRSLRDDDRFRAMLKKLGGRPQQTDNGSIDRPRPSSKQQAAKPQARAFEFMRGNWKIRNTFRSAAGSKQTDATSRGGEQLGGKVLIDHFDGTDWNDTRLRGMTIRAFDRQTKVWSLVWLDDRRAPRFTPMQGQFRNGIGVFYPKGSTAKTAKTRFHWDDIHRDRARWMQQTKTQTESGPRWVATWVMEFSR